jgi:hypothetical protein
MAGEQDCLKPGLGRCAQAAAVAVILFALELACPYRLNASGQQSQ